MYADLKYFPALGNIYLRRLRNQTNTTVISFMPSTNYTPSMRKGFV